MILQQVVIQVWFTATKLKVDILAHQVSVRSILPPLFNGIIVIIKMNYTPNDNDPKKAAYDKSEGGHDPIEQ